MVRAGGTLIVFAAVGTDTAAPGQGPPWPLIRSEIDAFATGDLTPVHIEAVQDSDNPGERRWRAEFHRPASEPHDRVQAHLERTRR
jgi:hypothetical protein